MSEESSKKRASKKQLGVPFNERPDWAYGTPTEAASVLSCSKNRVWALVRDGVIKTVKTGKNSTRLRVGDIRDAAERLPELFADEANAA